MSSFARKIKRNPYKLQNVIKEIPSKKKLAAKALKKHIRTMQIGAAVKK